MASIFTRVGRYHAVIAVPARDGGWASMVWDEAYRQGARLDNRPSAGQALSSALLVVNQSTNVYPGKRVAQ